MSVIIIDYGSGNLRSVAKAMEHAANGAVTVKISADPSDIHTASHIVLPGVGAFGDCARGLQAVTGLKEALADAVLVNKKPFLGICVGMQLLAEKGYEHGEHAGLGWINGEVVALRPADTALKIPHMGWNELNINNSSHPVLQGITTGMHAYFVHSFHFQCSQPDDVLATTEYGGDVVAIAGKDNIIATQFHPEKSQETGLLLLKNFLAWNPSSPST